MNDDLSIRINASLASLRAQVDSLVSVLNESDKNKYDKKLIDSIQNIYDGFENQFDKSSFEKFKILVKEMSLRNPQV